MGQECGLTWPSPPAAHSSRSPRDAPTRTTGSSGGLGRPPAARRSGCCCGGRCGHPSRVRRLHLCGQEQRRGRQGRAQKELASTEQELKQTEEQLGTSQGAGEILGDLARTGAKSADDLKVARPRIWRSRTRRSTSWNAAQAGSDVNPLIDGLNAAIDDNERQCNSSNQSYRDFVDSLNRLHNH